MEFRSLVKKIIPDIFLKNFREIKQRRKELVYNCSTSPSVKFVKNSYAGKRCFIIGGAPSLNLMDLAPLNNEFCFAVNKGFHLREKGISQVEFYGLSDHNAFVEYGNEIPLDFAKHICIFGSIPWTRNPEKVSYIPMYTNKEKSRFMSSGFFQFNILKPVAHTNTIILQMLQVAVYAGFKEIYIIGVDNDFSGTNMHFYQDSAEEKENMIKWNYDPTNDNELAFNEAYKILTRKGILIFNAGVGGKLKSLPRIDFHKLFI